MTGNKTFKDLTQTECVDAYKRMESNSDRRWQSAELLAANNDFGGAIRDHITSIEELVKAIIIYMDSNGFEFRKVEGMEKILTRSHSLRHFMAFLMFALNIFMEDIKKFFQKAKEDPSLVKVWGKKRKDIKNKIKMQKVMAVYMFKKALKFQAEFKWFEKVEKMRQTGTHVDFDEILITPEDISSKDYKQVLIRLNNVRFTGKEFLKTFDNPNGNLDKEIEKFKKDFHDEGWYIKIGETLNNMKNKNPFVEFTKEINRLDFGTTAEFKEHLRDKTLFEETKSAKTSTKLE